MLPLKGAVIALTLFAGLWKVVCHRVETRTQQQLIVWTTLLTACKSFHCPGQPRARSSPTEMGQSGCVAAKADSSSSSWPNSSCSLEEEGGAAWGHVVMAVQGDTERASQTPGFSPDIGQCLLVWHQICPRLLKVLMSSPHLLSCDQLNTISWDNAFRCYFKGRYDLRRGGCPHLPTQQAYLVPDSPNPENSQMRLVLGQSVTVDIKGYLRGLSQGHRHLSALAPSRKPCLRAFPAHLNSAWASVH